MGNCLSFQSKKDIKQDIPKDKSKDKSNNQLNNKEIQPFSLNDQWCLGYTVKVYDGDTFTINLNTSIGIHQWKIREDHIDTPEIKSNVPLEKLHARACRNMVHYLIGFKQCIVHCKGFEKYGRILGRVYIKKSVSDELLTENCTANDIQILQLNPQHPAFIDVGEWMLQNTPSLRYDGKKKAAFEFHANQYHPLYIRLFQTVLNNDKDDLVKDETK